MWYSVRVKEVDKEKIAEVAKSHNLKLLVLFGSQVTGQTHSKSDVDVAYLADRTIDYRENYDISIKLARIFNNPEVELVNLKNVSPEFKKQVADQGVVLYADNSSIFDLFKMYAFKMYVENKPIRELRRESIKNFIHAHA